MMIRTLLLLPLFACDFELPAEPARDLSATPVPCEEQEYFADLDGDGFTGSVEPVLACEAPPNHITDPYDHDCNDADPSVNAAAQEICNQEDTDCNGEIDDNLDEVTYFLDEDGDGVGGDTMLAACSPPGGAYVVEGEDCDDADPTRFPGAEEHCDGRDEDCNGEADDDPVDGFTYYPDADEDGFGGEAEAWRTCEAMDAPYLLTVGGDCDDWDPDVNPLGEESCNGVDDDCNGIFDDGMQTAMFWPDSDGDGSGDPGSIGVMACVAPEMHGTDDEDCDIFNSFVNPEAIEQCNGIDDDCDGTTDDENEDLDGDGFSVAPATATMRRPMRHRALSRFVTDSTTTAMAW